MSKEIDEIKEALKEQDARIDKINLRIWFVMGFIAAVSAGIEIAIQLYEKKGH